ncbi:unnamed protein product, partial [Mesorhabditis spiculigera]
MERHAVVTEVTQDAVSAATLQKVRLKMKNLTLHQHGTFSNVYRGTLVEPGGPMEVAIKKTWPEPYGDPISFEGAFLRGADRPGHKNIMQLLYTFRNDKETWSRACESFVFELMPFNLGQLIKSKEAIEKTDVKLYAWQLFSGLLYLEKNLIIHRDLKPVNVLVDPEKGILKITDFGSAKVVVPEHPSTFYQVTRFYRPPELILRSTRYDTTVDVWSAGCVLGEMLKRMVLFPGRDTYETLKLIVTILGSPKPEDVVAMKVTKKFVGAPVAPAGVKMLLPKSDDETLRVMEQLLVYDPQKRLRGQKFLEHPWFEEIFRPGARRKSGQPIAQIITVSDRAAVRDPWVVSKFTRMQQAAERLRRDKKLEYSHGSRSTGQLKPGNEAVKRAVSADCRPARAVSEEGKKEKIPSPDAIV